MSDTNDNRVTHMIEEAGGYGSVTIPDDAFGIIACISALEAEGVYAVDGTITSDKVAKLDYKNLSGVKVDVDEKDVTVYIDIRVRSTVSIPVTVKTVQEKVKAAIENMTGYTVMSVNVKVSDIFVGEAK